MPTTADARDEIVHLNPTVALGAGPDATDGPLAAGESPELRHDIGHFLFRQCAPRLSKLGFGFMRIAQIAPRLKVPPKLYGGTERSLRGWSISS
jgi:hypothetical protein